MYESNEKYRLKTHSRPATAISRFSSALPSRNLSITQNPAKRTHSAPIGREGNKPSQEHLEYCNHHCISTISSTIDNASLRGSFQTNDHIAETQYITDYTRPANTNIFITPPEELQQVTIAKRTDYEAPPLAEEERLEGQERQRAVRSANNPNPNRMPSSEWGTGRSSAKPCILCGLCGGISLFVVVFTIVVIADSMHTIDEGSVGIYFVQGALHDEVSHPGRHWATPFVTEVQQITTRPVTSTLNRIRTITRDGIGNIFDGVQVISDVNTNNLIELIKEFGVDFRQALIFDRISEELKIFCANHTVDEVYNELFLDIVAIVKLRVERSIQKLIGDGSIQILNLVIPKPDIPDDIARNYKQVKVQWTEQLVAIQQQKTDKIKKETESIKAVLDAEREKKVLQIEIEKDILQKEGEKNLSTLNNAIIKEREENKANVENYMKTQDAEANERLYTKDFVRLEMAKALSKNTKFFFSGESSPLGAVLAKIMGEAK